MEKIFLVEDEKDVRESLVDLLEGMGYLVNFASNGIDALTGIKNHLPDLVISDITMPGINGFELYNELRNAPGVSSIPFIFLSARAEYSEIRAGMNLGADDYLTKPFKAAELLNAVDTRLKKQKSVKNNIEEIASNVSLYIPHELRTPLVSILGFSDLILKESENINKKEILEMTSKIHDAGKRLNKTINKFIRFVESDLLLQKKKDSKLNFSVVTKSAEKVFYSVLANLQQDRVSDLILDLTDSSLKFAEEHLTYIVGELIENAVKFSNPGSPIVVRSYKDKNHYSLEITDYGRGMSSQEIASIYPFMQHKRDEFQQDGNGLGLITIKKLMEYYNGRLEITSNEGIFTTVRCLIPVQ